MYHKFARGHATDFLQRELKPLEVVSDWVDCPRARKALGILEERCKSKKPGRILKRIVPLIRPEFQNPTIINWSKDRQVISANSVNSANENEVFDPTRNRTPLYSERVAILSDLFLRSETDILHAEVRSAATISHHAIQRLMERGLATRESLGKAVYGALDGARIISVMRFVRNARKDEHYAYLLPFGDGALAAVTLSMRPKCVENPLEVLAIRTYLPPDMLSEEQRQRIGKYRTVREMLEAEGDDGTFEWMRANKLPWKLTSSPQDTEHTIRTA